MKKKIIGVTFITTVLMLLLSSGVFAGSHGSDSIQGIGYSYGGGSPTAKCTGMSSASVTTQMSSGGHLFSKDKAVALSYPSIYCHVDRVRVSPPGYSDLRIDPNFATNYVGAPWNTEKRYVIAVQKILNGYGYGLSLDGVWGTKTRDAVVAFQKSKNMNPDGVVGFQTWRGLCSSSGYKFASTIW